MSQFDVYPFAARGAGFRYIVDLQADLLDEMGSRLVAPIFALASAKRPLERINPVVHIDGEPYFIALQETASIRAKELGAAVANLRQHRDAIVAGIDFLFTGI